MLRSCCSKHACRRLPSAMHKKQHSPYTSQRKEDDQRAENLQQMRVLPRVGIHHSKGPSGSEHSVCIPQELMSHCGRQLMSEVGSCDKILRPVFLRQALCSAVHVAYLLSWTVWLCLPAGRQMSAEQCESEWDASCLSTVFGLYSLTVEQACVPCVASAPCLCRGAHVLLRAAEVDPKA